MKTGDAVTVQREGKSQTGVVFKVEGDSMIVDLAPPSKQWTSTWKRFKEESLQGERVRVPVRSVANR